MAKTGGILVLGTLAVVVSLAALLSQRDSTAISRSGELAFPALAPRVNDTAEVQAVLGGESFRVVLEEGRWRVPEKGGYPAAADQLRELVLGAAELELREPKTSNPKLYAKLGLGVPGNTEEKAPENAVRYLLRDRDGESLAGFAVGDRQASRADPALEEFYMLLGDDPQVWLVEGELPGARSVVDWLDKTVLSIDRERVREVRVMHPDGVAVVVTRATPQSSGFVLADIPEDAEVEFQWQVDDIGRGLTQLSLEDVKSASGIEFGDGLEVVMRTFDGLEVTMQTTAAGDETLARLSAKYIPASVASVGGDGGSSTASASDTEPPATHQEQAVRQEAAELNQRWQGWVYTLSRYRVSALDKRMADLTKPKGDV